MDFTINQHIEILFDKLMSMGISAGEFAQGINFGLDQFADEERIRITSEASLREFLSQMSDYKASKSQ